MAKQKPKNPTPAAPTPAAKPKRSAAAKKASPARGKRDYAGHREAMAEASREKSAKGREIGDPPPVKNPKRRARCGKSLKEFCETYLAERFEMAWSDDHVTVLTRLEGAVLRGGSFALAMPRGSGKTAICEAAALWAVLYAHRRFVALVGASDEAAVELLESLKLLIETNDLLFDDFPEVCYPVRMLEGQTGRANGQTINGERTRIKWTADVVVLPTVKGSKASGSVVKVAGITGRVRGMKAATADGKSIRPDFAIVDDPQTDDSADSLAQSEKRERIIKGAVKGLAGPGKTISLAVPCTVIAPGDLAERLLDRDRNPQFRGERMRMVYVFPERQDLWDKYADLRRASMRKGGDGEEATEFYRANRAEMDRGAVVAWPARFDPETELSALQAAMNLKIDNPIAFAAEFQNEPLAQVLPGMRSLDADELAARLSGVPRGEVPRECATLTAFVDIGKLVLWYAVCAFDSRFGGSLVDYGPYPAQNRTYFRADDARPTLADLYPKAGSEDARLHLGIRDLTNRLINTEYRRHETGEPHKVQLCLVDRGWKPEVVHKVCRAAPGQVLRPSAGHSVGSTGRLVRQWNEMPHEVPSPAGQPAWRWGYAKGEHNIGRRVIFDADQWKGFAADRLTTEPGGYAPLMLPGVPGKTQPDEHRLLCDHLAAEFGGPGRAADLEYEKWQQRPNRDNHLWDTVVGCHVAASVAGVRWSAAVAAGDPEPPPRKRKKVDIEELYRKAREEERGG